MLKSLRTVPAILILGRKGKNRCEGDPSGQGGPCRRCLTNHIECVYEKAGERKTRNGSVVGDLGGEAEG